MMDLDRDRIRLDDPGYPWGETPERRDFLDWVGWILVTAGLITLILAVAVVVGF